MIEKLETIEKEKEGLIKENKDFLKEKQFYEAEFDKLKNKNSELESKIIAEKQEKDIIILDQNKLILTYKENLQVLKEDMNIKHDFYVKENTSLKEKLEIVSKKNSFLTNRIYELNKEIEELKNEKSFSKHSIEDNLMIRPLNTRKSFELLSDTLTLKLNNLEKIFQNDYENDKRLSKENINQECSKDLITKEEVKKMNKMKLLSSEKNYAEKNKKVNYRSVSASRGHHSPDNQKGAGEENLKKIVRKKQKNEFESDFVKKFKRVITHLEARLENLAAEEINK